MQQFNLSADRRLFRQFFFERREKPVHDRQSRVDFGFF
jgi:hypothetical protein